MPEEKREKKKKKKGHTILIPQYNMLINTSIGALHTDSRFFNKNSRRESVISANRPTANVQVDRPRPMIVRKTKCQPYPFALAMSMSVLT